MTEPEHEPVMSARDDGAGRKRGHTTISRHDRIRVITPPAGEAPEPGRFQSTS